MIYTSYFANIKNLPETICVVSIAGKAPDWYDGIQYKKLAPKYWFFKKYKEDSDEQFYTEAFNREVLGALEVHKVITELENLASGKDICLLCYEKPCEFCHRHLVAKWLEEKLNIEVKEYGEFI